jgi:hypothetical protein
MSKPEVSHYVTIKVCLFDSAFKNVQEVLSPPACFFTQLTIIKCLLCSKAHVGCWRDCDDITDTFSVLVGFGIWQGKQRLNSYCIIMMDATTVNLIISTSIMGLDYPLRGSKDILK